jgi:hypothetical protein
MVFSSRRMSQPGHILNYISSILFPRKTHPYVPDVRQNASLHPFISCTHIARSAVPTVDAFHIFAAKLRIIFVMDRKGLMPELPHFCGGLFL